MASAYRTASDRDRGRDSSPKIVKIYTYKRKGEDSMEVVAHFGKTKHEAVGLHDALHTGALNR